MSTEPLADGGMISGNVVNGVLELTMSDQQIAMAQACKREGLPFYIEAPDGQRFEVTVLD